jgi:hypothetical protein
MEISNKLMPASSWFDVPNSGHSKYQVSHTTARPRVGRLDVTALGRRRAVLRRCGVLALYERPCTQAQMTEQAGSSTIGMCFFFEMGHRQ